MNPGMTFGTWTVDTIHFLFQKNIIHISFNILIIVFEITGQLAKFTSHMYKCLSAEEKTKWEAHAAQDKARFEAEMASYVPPPGYDQSGNLVEDRRVSMKKYQKKPKDPEQPKVRFFQ